MTIADMKIGEFATIINVFGNDELRLRLLDMGFVPNTKIKLQKFAPFKNPLQIYIRGYELAIRKEDAKKIQIKKE